MAGWRRHRGRVAALAIDNIDTDQLIPARFMSTPRSAGYGRFLLHDLAAQGLKLDPTASILIAGHNFGCGSSREAAVYALVDFGIKAVIAPSFGDIFAANAINNGLLPARLDNALLIAGAEARIDLETLQISQDGRTYDFALDPVWQEKLINGWDDIDLTAQHQSEISAFRERYVAQSSWTVPKPKTA
jgi:3-isopropylmalate/(R)-2-methylmalate dehydratase small subunit